MILSKNIWISCFILFLVAGLPLRCHTMELEPRRWSHLPLGINFIGTGCSHTEADIYFDPVIKIEHAKMEMHTLTVKYLRTFELFEKSARIDYYQNFQEGRWNGLLNGVPSSVSRNGLADSILRFAINLYGAPPLEGKEFTIYRSKTDVETIAGTALAVHIPTGQYMDDKLINLGANRYTFRPQFGVVHNRGKWSMEITGSVWIYSDNDDFYNEINLEQDPLYSIQTHLVYNFRPGIWISGSAGYGYGGKTTLNGEDNNDLRENLGSMLSMGYPITRQLGMKIVYPGIRTLQPVGQDSDSIGVGFSFFW